MSTKTNKDLYKLTAELTVVEDTPEQVEELWNGVWDAVYINYADSVGTIIRGFAECGFNGQGKPAAKLVNAFCDKHGISPQAEQFLDNNATRNLCLVTVGSLSREFTDCILRNVFTAIGVLCRQGNNVKLTCGKVGKFVFTAETKMYRFDFDVISKKHPNWRDERLCELAGCRDCYDQADPKKHTDKITFKSSAKPIARPAESFDLTTRQGYMGMVENK